MPWPRCVRCAARAAPRRRRADSQALNTTSGGSRPSADRCAPVSSPSASARPPSPGTLRVEGGVTGVVNDVVSAGFEFRGDARERRRVAGDFGEAHGLAAAEQVRDAFALGFGAGQVAGRIGDEQHAELALLAASGVEARGHQVGGGVAPRQSAIERREPAAQVERFPGNAAARGIVHHRERLAARGKQRARQRRMQRERAELRAQRLHARGSQRFALEFARPAGRAPARRIPGSARRWPRSCRR